MMIAVLLIALSPTAPAEAVAAFPSHAECVAKIDPVRRLFAAHHFETTRAECVSLLAPVTSIRPRPRP